MELNNKMSTQIKLTVTQNDKLMNSITKTVDKQHLIKSLEEFQLEANAALSKMIEELGEIGETIGDANVNEDDEDDEDDEETDDVCESSQSTGKESNGHSESKKKKHH